MIVLACTREEHTQDGNGDDVWELSDIVFLAHTSRLAKLVLGYTRIIVCRES